MKLQLNKLTKKVCQLIFPLVVFTLSQTLNAQGDDAESLVETCVICHGESGISVNELWPNLAGQQQRYLVNQMIAYRDKTRDVPEMWALMKDFSDEQIEVIANHYSAMPSPEPSGEEINLAGQYVRAYCVSCHGMSGNSIAPEWPNLAGQKATYLAQQLMAYKTGERQHPLMNVIANEITEQNIADVAEYYSQIGIERAE